MRKQHDRAADMEGAPISTFSESKSTLFKTSELRDELQRIINTSATSESVSSQGSGANIPSASEAASSRYNGANTPTASEVALSHQQTGINTPTSSEATSSQQTGINTPTTSELPSSQRSGVNTPTVSETISTQYSGANTPTTSKVASSTQSGRNTPRVSQASKVRPTRQPPTPVTQPQTFPVRISLTKGDCNGHGRTVESDVIMMDANLRTVEEVATTLKSHFIISRARNWDPDFHKCTRIRAAFSSQADKTINETNQDIMALTNLNTSAILSALQQGSCNQVSLDAWIVEKGLDLGGQYT